MGQNCVYSITSLRNIALEIHIVTKSSILDVGKMSQVLIIGVFRTNSKTCDDFLVWKHLTVFNRYLFSKKSFIIDVWQDSKYSFVAGIDYLQWSLLYLRNNANSR